MNILKHSATTLVLLYPKRIPSAPMQCCSPILQMQGETTLPATSEQAGIIPLLWKRDGNCQKIYGIEIQEKGYSQFLRSVEADDISNSVFPIHSDLKQLKGKLPQGAFDLVTMNPPYKKENAGIKSEKTNEKIARHETLCTIDDICTTAASLLKFGGRFCLCIRPERLFETMKSMSEHKLEPKRLRLVTSRDGEKPWLCLIESRLGGKSGLTVEKYTEEMDSLLVLYRED